QGGNPAVTEDYSLFGGSKRQKEIFADREGYICGISCEETGMTSLKLGAGRETKESDIDPTAGIVFQKTVGDFVQKGEKIAVLHTSTECDLEEIAENFAKVFKYGGKEECPPEKNIIKIVKGY
ncbi:MAG: hypothetical protein NC192_11970, partial [Muribaculaceae bacterium]|nr:hypothetical protein [Muribaculaceae bacterium]